MKKTSNPIKKGEVPNTIAVRVTCFSALQQMDTDYRTLIESLELEAKTKKGQGLPRKKHKKSTKKAMSQ